MKVLFFSSNFQGVRKISALLVCMLFVFVFVVSPIKVKAEAFPIPPLWLPMNPYNAQGLEGNYVLLSDDQKKIVHEVIGAANSVYLGMGGYVLINPILGVQATREFYQEYGSTFLNTFWSQIMGTSRTMTDFVGSTIYKASTYDTYADYEADTSPSVSSANHKYFQISPELTVAFKNWYRANGGVEDWQIQTKPFSTSVTWKTESISSISNYYTYLNNLAQKHIRINSYSYKNQYVTNSQFISYNCIFINTTNNTVYFVNELGQKLNTGTYQVASVYTYDGIAYSSNYADYLYVRDYSIPNTFNSYVDVIRYLYDHTNELYFSGQFMFWEDFVAHVYVGANWASKQELFNIDDLNIGSTDSEYIQNIEDVGYVDINSLIGQIADEVVNLREVVEESVLVKDGDTAIPYADSLQVAIDKFINQPKSGVVIPVDIFGGLTGANGPVSYLWFMTKPLVSYTGDLLGLLTLDGDGTFQFTGLGYIVVGVVTVGIIGGLVTKCLL